MLYVTVSNFALIMYLMCTYVSNDLCAQFWVQFDNITLVGKLSQDCKTPSDRKPAILRKANTSW